MSKSLVKIRPVLGAVHAPGWLRAPIMQSTIASVSSAPLYVQHWGLTAATRSPRVATSTACGSKAAAAPTMVHAPTAFFLPALRGARAAWAAKTARTLRAQHTKIVRSGLAPARELASAAPQSDPRAAACGELIDVEPIALQFRERIRSKFQQLAALGIERPSLVALLASDDEAALSYAEWTAKVRQPYPPSPPQQGVNGFKGRGAPGPRASRRPRSTLTRLQRACLERSAPRHAAAPTPASQARALSARYRRLGATARTSTCGAPRARASTATYSPRARCGCAAPRTPLRRACLPMRQA